MQNETLEIVFEDEHIVAINKPTGLLVHKSPIDKHETRFALQILRDMLGYRVHPIHRLDKPTSGLLLFAKNVDANKQMQALFSDQKISKHYLAVVRGFTPDNLTIDHPVKAQVDKKYQPDIIAKNGTTVLHTIDKTELDISIDKYPKTRYSLVRLSPKTGRRHQLRYHMKHISHPIIGDAKYGKSIHNNYFKQALSCPRLMLSAFQLAFTHPYTDVETKLTACPDGVFLSTCQQLGFSNSLTNLGFIQ